MICKCGHEIIEIELNTTVLLIFKRKIKEWFHITLNSSEKMVFQKTCFCGCCNPEPKKEVKKSE